MFLSIFGLKEIEKGPCKEVHLLLFNHFMTLNLCSHTTPSHRPWGSVEGL